MGEIDPQIIQDMINLNTKDLMELITAVSTAILLKKLSSTDRLTLGASMLGHATTLMENSDCKFNMSITHPSFSIGFLKYTTDKDSSP